MLQAMVKTPQEHLLTDLTYIFMFVWSRGTYAVVVRYLEARGHLVSRVVRGLKGHREEVIRDTM